MARHAKNATVRTRAPEKRTTRTWQVKTPHAKEKKTLAHDAKIQKQDENDFLGDAAAAVTDSGDADGSGSDGGGCEGGGAIPAERQRGGGEGCCGGGGGWIMVWMILWMIVEIIVRDWWWKVGTALPLAVMAAVAKAEAVKAEAVGRRGRRRLRRRRHR